MRNARALLAALFLVLLSIVPAQAAPATVQDVTMWLQTPSPTSFRQCFDVAADLRVNGVTVSTAQTYPMLPVCLTNSMIARVPLSFSPTVTNINPGDVVEVVPRARYRIVENVYPYGMLSIWYNGSPGSNTDSLLRADLGTGPQTYHLKAANQLSSVGSSGPLQRNAFYMLLRGSWYNLGTWGRIAP